MEVKVEFECNFSLSVTLRLIKDSSLNLSVNSKIGVSLSLRPILGLNLR